MAFSGRLSIQLEMTLEDSEVELIEDALTRLLEDRVLSFTEVLDFTVTSEKYSG